MGNLSILADIKDERARQDQKWGQQDHPDGTGRMGCVELADYHRQVCKNNSPDNDNWQDILSEEVYEAYAEIDEKELRKELVQVAAVVVAWIEAIDRRRDA